MKIVVLGSGGREHAISWKLAQSENVEKVFVLPGNGGTKNNVNIAVNDFAKIKEFCQNESIELIVVGPEDPLANGIVDYFLDTPVMVFGPEKRAAILESSKIWSKNFMKKYNVATADFWKLNATEKVKASEIISKTKGNCVLKYDGLAAGKGVFVCSNISEAKSSLAELIRIYGDDANYLIEEKLVGQELSLLAFTDGKDYKLLLPSQDHKQLLENDKGPNTGGMGAFCPVPFYNENIKNSIIKEIVEPTMQGVRTEKFNYKGVIYFGVMLTETGPKLLEYNVRLGDPETEVVLPALKSDLADLILACFEDDLTNYQMEFNDDFFVDVVLVSGGYPKSYSKGYEIFGINDVSSDTLIFHAGTKQENGKTLSNGGRVINVVAKGKYLENTITKVYDECKNINFENSFYRKDIGRRNR